MQIPIYLDGREAGTLTITERGPMTELTAQLDGVSQVVRLTVYGSNGESFYLGVPEPKEGGLILVRRITPALRRGKTGRYTAGEEGAAAHPVARRKSVSLLKKRQRTMFSAVFGVS